MGCGCKKNRNKVRKKAIDNGEVIDTTPPSVVEDRDYQRKISEALKQFADIKLRKRNLRG